MMLKVSAALLIGLTANFAAPVLAGVSAAIAQQTPAPEPLPVPPPRDCECKPPVVS